MRKAQKVLIEVAKHIRIEVKGEDGKFREAKQGEVIMSCPKIYNMEDEDFDKLLEE